MCLVSLILICTPPEAALLNHQSWISSLPLNPEAFRLDLQPHLYFPSSGLQHGRLVKQQLLISICIHCKNLQVTSGKCFIKSLFVYLRWWTYLSDSTCWTVSMQVTSILVTCIYTITLRQLYVISFMYSCTDYSIFFYRFISLCRHKFFNRALSYWSAPFFWNVSYPDSSFFLPAPQHLSHSEFRHHIGINCSAHYI